MVLDVNCRFWLYDRKVVSGISASVLFIGFVVVVRRCVGISTHLHTQASYI